MVRPLLALLLTAPLFALDLSPKLAQWKTEIEQEGGIPIAISDVLFSPDGSEMRLPDGTPGAARFGAYLSQPQFAAEFRHMFAVMVHHRQPLPEQFLIMLNGARRPEFEGNEDAVLGHELGHAMLRARRYPTPRFLPGALACLAIHTGDIVQHVLIRSELDSRGISHRRFWMKSLDDATKALGTGTRPPEADRCAVVRQAAQLVDVRLGLRDADWPGRDAYEAAVRRAYPEVQETAVKIVNHLDGRDVTGKVQHQLALQFVFECLRDLAQQRTRDYILENKPSDSGAAVVAVIRSKVDPGAAWCEPRASA